MQAWQTTLQSRESSHLSACRWLAPRASQRLFEKSTRSNGRLGGRLAGRNWGAGWPGSLLHPASSWSLPHLWKIKLVGLCAQGHQGLGRARRYGMGLEQKIKSALYNELWVPFPVSPEDQHLSIYTYFLKLSSSRLKDHFIVKWSSSEGELLRDRQMELSIHKDGVPFHYPKQNPAIKSLPMLTVPQINIWCFALKKRKKANGQSRITRYLRKAFHMKVTKMHQIPQRTNQWNKPTNRKQQWKGIQWNKPRWQQGKSLKHLQQIPSER